MSEAYSLDTPRADAIGESATARNLDWVRSLYAASVSHMGRLAGFQAAAPGPTAIPTDVLAGRQPQPVKLQPGGALTHVRLSGNSRRSLPDYIFSGPRPGKFFVLECKGTQSSRATAVNQLQRGTEEVLTVDIAGAKNVTCLVIAVWLQQAIMLLIVEPVEEDDNPVEVRKLSRCRYAGSRLQNRLSIARGCCWDACRHEPCRQDGLLFGQRSPLSEVSK